MKRAVILLACAGLLGCAARGPEGATRGPPADVPPCANGARDPGEADVDCGGACGACGLGRACGGGDDCLGRRCQGGRCTPSEFGFDAPRGVDAPPAGAFAVADLDGDGVLDVALRGVAPEQGGSLLRGRGAGGYLPAVAIPALAHVTGGPLGAGDLDGDGAPDLVAVVPGDDPAGVDRALILWGDGRGELLRGPEVPLGGGSIAVAVADVSGDGHAEAMVLSAGSRELLVLSTDARRGFTRTSYPVGPAAAALALGDLDRDGVLDVVIGSDNGVHAFVGGPTLRRVASPALGEGVRSLVLGDLDGDGLVDAALASDGVPLRLVPGRGDGSFGAPRGLSACCDPLVGVLDVDGDGRRDLLLAHGVLRGLGGGRFAEPAALPSGLVVALAMDLDGDGRPDLAGIEDGWMVQPGLAGGSFLSARIFEGGLQPVALMPADSTVNWRTRCAWPT